VSTRPANAQRIFGATQASLVRGVAAVRLESRQAGSPRRFDRRGKARLSSPFLP
jgi:hypothetical protein